MPLVFGLGKNPEVFLLPFKLNGHGENLEDTCLHRGAS